MEIREARESDLAELLQIYNDIIQNTTAVWHNAPFSADRLAIWYADRQQQGYPVYVAVQGGQVVGYSSFGPFRAWEGYRFTVECSVYVRDGMRGEGVGVKLLMPLIDAARGLGLHAMIAGIDAENNASLHLFRKLGFQEVAHLPQVGQKFGRWLDLKLLQLML
jgi:phosphinothricin acetyltransferase